MTAAYAIAATPEPYQILGVRLKPFCLGHCLHMMRFNVAFALDAESPPSLSDLLLGITICSQSYEDFIVFIEDPAWETQVKEWGAKAGKFDFVEKCGLFQKYIADGSKQPIVIFDGDGKPSGTHWTHAIKIALIDLGYTPSEALNIPLSQALYDFYKAAENKGALHFADPNMLQVAGVENV